MEILKLNIEQIIRRTIAAILPKQRKTTINQSINHMSIKYSRIFLISTAEYLYVHSVVFNKVIYDVRVDITIFKRYTLLRFI